MGSIKRVFHCSHWGAYTILVQDGKVVGIQPFSEDPAPSGIIHSVMGWADPSKRILKPLVREGWLKHREKSDGTQRGRDRYVEVTWDQALDLVAQEIDRVRNLHGNSSIFAGSYGWTSCGRFHHAPSQLKRMLNLVGGYTGHVDTYSIAAGPSILRAVLGSDQICRGGQTTLDVISEHTQLLVVFGAMTPRTAQCEAGGIGRHMVDERLRRLKERGARIIHVSPARDDIPAWANAEWWPIRPNTDTALMLALAQELVCQNKHDQAFLDRYCSGAAIFLDYLAGKNDGTVKNALWAEKITGIPAVQIRKLALDLVATRSMISASWSLQRADHGEQPYWAALGLASVVGQIGLPGGGVGYGYASLGGVGEPVPLTKAPAIPQGTKPISNFIPVARISDLLLNPGMPFDFEGKVHTYPDTRLVYWAGGNPFHHHQEINRLRRAWARPETIVVQDPVWTATAARGDIILPATTSIERNDFAASERSDFIVSMQKAIEPIGSSRTDYDIFRSLSERLGVEREFSEGRNEMDWLRFLYEATRTDCLERLGLELPDFDTVWEIGWTKVPSRSNFTIYSDFRADPVKAPLPTESGRILLVNETIAKLGFDDCRGHPSWIEPAEWLNDEALSSGDLFHLISRQPPGKLHSQLDDERESVVTKDNGRERVALHPNDGARLGISDGDIIRLWNARGQVLASASFNDAICERVVILPTGSRYTPADGSDNALDLTGNPNVLTLDKGTSRFGQGCAAHTCLVHVELVGKELGETTCVMGREPEAVI